MPNPATQPPPPPPSADDIGLFGCFALIVLGMLGAALLRAASEPLF